MDKEEHKAWCWSPYRHFNNSPGHNQNWIYSSCNLIGSDAEPKHWLDRERTKFQINFSCRKYRMLVGYRENQP